MLPHPECWLHLRNVPHLVANDLGFEDVPRLVGFSFRTFKSSPNITNPMSNFVRLSFPIEYLI